MRTLPSELLIFLCILVVVVMVYVFFKFVVPYLSKNLFLQITGSSRRKIIEPAKLLLTTTSVVSEYHEFLVPKKDGTSRVIHAPSAELKDIQKNLLGSLNTSLRMPAYVSGFCRGRSLWDNARAHVGKKVVINIDVENFFPSFTLSKVQKALETLSIFKGVVSEAVRITTYRGSLPQGAPTSPFIANLAFIPVDEAILALLKKYDPEVGYTRYADDITFSSNNSKIVNAIRIIEDGILPRFGFVAKKKKTCVYRNHTRQTVTGLVVNGEKPRITRERYMKIRSLVWKELCGKPVVPLATLKGHLAFLHDADRLGYSKLKKSLSKKVEKSALRKVFL